MKIAVFHELSRGGAKRSVYEFAKNLKKNNLVDLYMVDERIDKETKEIFNNIFFYKFVPRRWFGQDWKIRLYKDTIELFFLYNLHRKIAAEINKKDYNLALVHPSKFTQAPFLLRFIKGYKAYYCQEPLRMVYEDLYHINSELGVFKQIYESLIRQIRKIIDKKNFAKSDLILVNSKFTKENVQKIYQKNSVVCSPGVDPLFFKPANSIKKYFDILFIGSDPKIDRFSLLRNAVSHMRKTPTIKTINRNKEWVSDSLLCKIYNQSKVLLCLAYREPFGLAPLEAMSCGIPVIAVNQGGYRETVMNGRTGFLVSGEAKDLAQKLDLLINNARERNKMGREGRKEVIRNWTWKIRSQFLEDTLKKFIYEKNL